MTILNEDQESWEAIVRLDERINTEERKIDGKETIIIHEDYGSRDLFIIEKFVTEIIKNEKRGGFTIDRTRYTNRLIIKELYFGHHYYHLMNQCLEHYSDKYIYSPRVEAFYDICKSMGMLGQKSKFMFGIPEEIEPRSDDPYLDLFNKLIDKIREHCNRREFKERERLREVNTQRNIKNVLEMEEAMFSAETGRSRWLVLSLTLGYQPELRKSINLEMIQQHRERFFAARRFNNLMIGIQNYAWKIEQGKDTGLHLHVILFYSAVSNRDQYIAQQIGEYWNDGVTEGKGAYWNSNDEKRKKYYEKRGHGVGVGQINWNDVSKRCALRENLKYLAKADQYLMIKNDGNAHTFGMGTIPKKAKSGRPRTN